MYLNEWLVGFIGGIWSTLFDKEQKENDTMPYFSALKPKERKSTVFRPEKFDQFVGNTEAVARLSLSVGAAQKLGRPLPHILLYGNPGLGKTTLANIVAKEMGSNFISITGSTVATEYDLFKMLYKLDGMINPILFIDEIHQIGKNFPETVWYPILEDFILYHNLEGKTFNTDNNVFIISGNTIQMKPFTIIGATTDPAMLEDAFRDRFQIALMLKEYTKEDIIQVITYHANARDIPITNIALNSLANRVRGNPRRALSYLLACYDRMIVKDNEAITEAIVKEQMDSQHVDNMGLTDTDIQILEALYENEKGLGIANLAGTCGIKKKTLEEMIEPYLKQKKLIKTTHRRFITELGKEVLENYRKEVGNGL